MRANFVCMLPAYARAFSHSGIGGDGTVFACIAPDAFLIEGRAHSRLRRGQMAKRRRGPDRVGQEARAASVALCELVVWGKQAVTNKRKCSILVVGPKGEALVLSPCIPSVQLVVQSCSFRVSACCRVFVRSDVSLEKATARGCQSRIAVTFVFSVGFIGCWKVEREVEQDSRIRRSYKNVRGQQNVPCWEWLAPSTSFDTIGVSSVGKRAHASSVCCISHMQSRCDLAR